jgi:hypothetical protein
MKKHEHIDISKDKNIDKDIILDDLRDYELGVAGKLTKAFITSPLSKWCSSAWRHKVKICQHFVTHLDNRSCHFLPYIKPLSDS